MKAMPFWRRASDVVEMSWWSCLVYTELRAQALSNGDQNIRPTGSPLKVLKWVTA